MNSLLALLILISPLAHAKLDTCESAVTPDQKYGELKASMPNESRESVALTHLLNSAFTPFLKKIADTINGLSSEELEVFVKRYENLFSQQNWGYPPSLTAGKYGLNASYAGTIEFRTGTSRTFPAPFTEYSKSTAQRLSLAVTIAENIAREQVLALHGYLLEDSQKLRKECTFTNIDMNEALFFAFSSITEGAGALIASPIQNRSADEVLREVMSQKGRFPSHVVMLALLLPPRMLGQTGGLEFFKNSLVETEKGLSINPEFKAVLKKNRDRFMASEGKQSYEFGHGCPVGHTMNGEERSGLQHILDAVMRIYEVIE